MNKLYVLLGLLFLSFAINIDNVNAQGWVKEIPIRNGFIINDKIVASNDSGFWALGQIDDTVNTFSCLQTDFSQPFPIIGTCRRFGIVLQKYNSNGQKLLEKIFYSTNNLEALSPSVIINCSDNSGVIIIYGKQTWQKSTFTNIYTWITNSTKAAKLDNSGNVIWAEKAINNIDLSGREVFLSEKNNKINNYAFVHSDEINTTATDSSTFRIFAKRNSYDNNLNLLQQTNDTMYLKIPKDSYWYYEHDWGNFFSNVFTETSTGEHYTIFTLMRQESQQMDVLYEKYYLIKYDVNYKFQFIKLIDSFSIQSFTSRLVENNGLVYFATEHKIYKIDNNGNLLQSIPNNFRNQLFINTRVVSNNIQWLTSNIPNGNVSSKIYLNSTNTVNLNTTRKDVKIKQLRSSLPYINTYPANIKLKDNSLVIGLYYQPASVYLPALAKIDTLGNCSISNISGSVFGDRNSNCNLETTDVGLRSYSVKATSTKDTFYTTTDSLGKYELYIDTGFYKVSLLPNLIYPLWDANVCIPLKQVHLTDNDTITTNFALFPKLSCPNLTAEINTAFLRRCFTNTYKVDYCNNGTLNANNAYIDITFDSHLQYTSSTINAFPVGNNVYRFPVGNVQMGNCGSFNVTVYLDCDSTIIGQTHCVDAHIYPDTMCIESSYNGPIIEASAVCKDSIIEFKLKNKGTNMPGAKHYIVIEDQIIRQSNNYQLAAGQEIIVRISTRNGSTYRIEAEQDAAFPAAFGDAIAAAFVEGCTRNPGDTFRVGIINNYPLYDGEPYRDIDCHENRGSIDPNEKLAYPKGVDAQHFITKTTPIDYTILFQNTGTDTAFYIKVIDTISPYLDINTLRITNVSHPYTFTRIDSNIIVFEFNPIKLVDSTTNEPNSHGFVMFKINQKANNAIGTVIKNKVDIIFDFNNAITTNTTFHTVGENYLRVDITTNNISNKYSNIELNVYPNPFRDKAIFQIKNVELKNAHLLLYDLSGNITKEINFFNHQITLNRDDLANGLYIYKLLEGNEIIATGKISIQ